MLYLCPTPIGNLRDITLRVLDTLRSCDVIYAEDTRHSRKLLSHYEIDTPLRHYSDHHDNSGLEALLADLKEDRSVALISDAGMPLVSDPGHRLLKRCLEEGLPFEVLPGPTALINAWVYALMEGEAFSFYGFLPRKSGDLRRFLLSLQNRPETSIFYEAPHRLEKSLKLMQEVLGDRKVVLAREMTKHYEEILRMSISEMLQLLESRELKGEMVLVVAGSYKEEPTWNIKALLEAKLKAGFSKKEAIRLIAEETNIPKNKLYRESLDL